MLASWEAIDLQDAPPRITISGGTAKVRQNYRLRGKRGGKELTLEGEATLQLRREADGEWRIVSGL